jgi:hypothetical protein
MQQFKGALFGHDLLRWLQYNRYTLRDAQAVTGINISVLSRLTHGKTPDLLVFATLCDAMHAPMGDYFERLPVVDKGD